MPSYDTFVGEISARVPLVGIDPEKAQIEPATKLLDPQAKERLEIQAYMRAITDELLKPATGEISRNH